MVPIYDGIYDDLLPGPKSSESLRAKCDEIFDLADQVRAAGLRRGVGVGGGVGAGAGVGVGRLLVRIDLC